jgi:hypothetical protein
MNEQSRSRKFAGLNLLARLRLFDFDCTVQSTKVRSYSVNLRMVLPQFAGRRIASGTNKFAFANSGALPPRARVTTVLAEPGTGATSRKNFLLLICFIAGLPSLTGPWRKHRSLPAE